MVFLIICHILYHSEGSLNPPKQSAVVEGAVVGTWKHEGPIVRAELCLQFSTPVVPKPFQPVAPLTCRAIGRLPIRAITLYQG